MSIFDDFSNELVKGGSGSGNFGHGGRPGEVGGSGEGGGEIRGEGDWTLKEELDDWKEMQQTQRGDYGSEFGYLGSGYGRHYVPPLGTKQIIWASIPGVGVKSCIAWINHSGLIHTQGEKYDISLKGNALVRSGRTYAWFDEDRAEEYPSDSEMRNIEDHLKSKYKGKNFSWYGDEYDATSALEDDYKKGKSSTKVTKEGTNPNSLVAHIKNSRPGKPVLVPPIISHLKNVHGTPGALKTEQSGDLMKGGQGSGNFGHGGRPGERGGSSFHEVLDSAGWKLRDVEGEERKPGSRMRSIYTHSGFPNHQIMVYTKNGVGSEDTPKGEWIHYGGWPGTGNLPDPRTWATSNPDTESSYTPNIRGNDEGASSLEAYLRELEATKSGDLSDEDKKFLSDLGISEKVAKVLLSVLEKRAKKPKQQDQDEEPANEDFDFDEDQNGNDDDEDYLEKFANYLVKGGPGSGNFGHSGRPGEVGGSGGSSTQESNDSSFREKLRSIISNLPQKLRDALKHHLAPIVGGDLFLDTKAILGEKGKDSVEKLTSDHEAAASFHTEMAKHHFSGDKHMSTLGIDHEEAEKAHLDVICAIRSKNLEKISELDELAKSKSSWVLSKEFYV